MDHSVLLRKLYSFGITDQELKWFEDYLRNRSQVVNYQNVFSDNNSITSGVPQGSILWSLLFVLFVNDLPAVARCCSMLMCADDTAVFYSAKDAKTIEEKLNEELGLIDAWLRDKNLFLNVEKTECMLFRTRGKLSSVESLDMTINGNVIKQVYEFKYPGVLFDECLSWNAHVKHVIFRAGKRLGMLRRIRENLTTSCANTIYKSFILPIMDYCDSVWACCGKGNANLLEKLQRQ